MPRVPDFSAQASSSGLSTPSLASPNVQNAAPQQLQQLGQQVERAGQVAGGIAVDMQQRFNETVLTDSARVGMEAATGLQLEATKLVGKAALDRPDGKALPDEYGEKLKKRLDEIGATLKNDAQRYSWNEQSSAILGNFKNALSGHMVAQQGVYEKEVLAGKIEMVTNRGILLYSDEAEVKGAQEELRLTALSEARKLGLDPKVDKDSIDAMLIKAVSPLHSGVIGNYLKAGRSVDAKNYYDQHSAEMSIQARATLGPAIHEAAADQSADDKAAQIWGKHAPQTANDSVNIFAMTEEARSDPSLKGNRDALDRTLKSLKSRFTEFNEQQKEANAQSINGVYKLIDSGLPFSAVKRSQDWIALPAIKQHEIIKEQEELAATRERRSESAAQKQLAQLQINERLNYLRNGDEYLAASDPAVLSTMTKAEVAALRVKFGMDATKHLLDKHEQLLKPGALIEAKIDKEDFDQVADDMGLNPYAANKSEDDKRMLGTLKYRIEQLIDNEQSKNKTSLTRARKQQIIREEMAKTVTVQGGFFSNQYTKPILSLTKEEEKRIIVPEDKAKKAIEALSKLNKLYPNNPDYIPTASNIRKTALDMMRGNNE